VSEKYAFIAAQYADHTAADVPTIAQMTGWLGVSKSGYYEWLHRTPSPTAARHAELALKVAALFEEFDGTYGYRRVHAELVRGGEQVGDELVRTLMREMKLVAVQPKPYKRTTIAGDAAPGVPDLVRRDFSAQAPGEKLVGDITYISTWAGWVYLATVIDCFNKEVIGYAMAEHMRAELVVDALMMAARNHDLRPGCIMHSDRGSQYTSAEFVAGVPAFVGIMLSRNHFSPA
jgi:transposase InsO family protein